MTLSVLPIKQNINQEFDCTLPIDNKNRQFRFIFQWNPIGDYWQCSITDMANEVEIVNHQPICQILFPYNNIISHLRYKNIGSLYVVNLKGGTDRPNYTNLSTDYSLVWGDTPNAEIS